MLAIAGSTNCLVHIFWPMPASNNDWLVTELSAGFLDKDAQFSADVTLSLTNKTPALFINANLTVSDMRCNDPGSSAPLPGGRIPSQAGSAG